jgi:hypothetical protein
METIAKYNYKYILNRILQCTFKQLTEFLGIIEVYRNEIFIVLQKGEFNFIVFLNADSNELTLYDISLRKSIKKDELFIKYYHLTGYEAYYEALGNIPLKNEFTIFKPYKSELILALYFGNYSRSRFPEKYLNFNSLTTDIWFNKFITYNEKLKRFSLPLFNNNTFGVANFVDFIDNDYKFRFKTPFSVFYPVAPSNAYKPIISSDDEPDGAVKINENHLIISFNPILLIESREKFKSFNINYYPVLLEQDITTLKFLEFNNLINPFIFEKILILYSNEQVFCYRDLLNTMLFLIKAVNFYQKDFYLEYDYSFENKFTIIITRHPESINTLDITEMFAEVNDLYINELSGKNNNSVIIDSVMDNINFLKENCYNFHLLKTDNNNVYFFDIPLKVETTLLCCQWLIKKFLINIELVNIRCSSIFSN